RRSRKIDLRGVAVGKRRKSDSAIGTGGRFAGDRLRIFADFADRRRNRENGVAAGIGEGERSDGRCGECGVAVAGRTCGDFGARGGGSERFGDRSFSSGFNRRRYQPSGFIAKTDSYREFAGGGGIEWRNAGETGNFDSSASRASASAENGRENFRRLRARSGKVEGTS